MSDTFFQQAREFQNSHTPFATAYVVNRKVPSSGKPGDKAIITHTGEVKGWIGGGCTRGIVVKEAQEALVQLDNHDNNNSYAILYYLYSSNILGF